MATIYRGRDDTLDRNVAVKVLHPHLAEDDDLRERFRAEARAAAGLLHPHIVNVFDHGSAGSPYIIMEYVDGPSLREVLNARGRLSVREALAVLEPVCAGLTRAHRAGVVHRDVKPENVLIASDGTVKVADFGIARAVTEAGATATGALLASVDYVAPEVVQGLDATPASDQYAVGVLLYELVTGRVPLPADAPTAAITRHVREDVGPPSEVVDGIPPGLDEVVLRATARDPADRYPDLTALVAALRVAVPEGPAQVVLRSSPAGHSGTLIIPREALDTTMIAAPLTSAHPEPPIDDGWGDGPEPSAWDEPELEPSRSRARTGVLWTVLLIVALLAAGGGWIAYDQVLAPVRQVPQLVGTDRAAAIAALDDLGLAARFAADQPSRDVPANQVLTQDPPPGAGVRLGGEVTLTLSSGPEILPMPRVLELGRDAAVAVLQGEPYGFEVQVDEAFSETVARGIVQGQLPNPDEPLAEGSRVIINVSLGVEQVPVPDLVGQRREQAEVLLAEARLEGSFTEEISDTVEAGTVIRQTPEPGTGVDRDSAVQVVVSQGSGTILMPDLLGQPLDAALAVVAGLGLEAEVIEREQPGFGPFRTGEVGLVEAQAPNPGDEVQAGERVRLLTFVAPPPEEGGDDGGG